MALNKTLINNGIEDFKEERLKSDADGSFHSIDLLIIQLQEQETINKEQKKGATRKSYSFLLYNLEIILKLRNELSNLSILQPIQLEGVNQS